jgi:hypothetical protein
VITGCEEAKLSAASCGEASILKDQYRSAFARYRIQNDLSFLRVIFSLIEATIFEEIAQLGKN